MESTNINSEMATNSTIIESSEISSTENELNETNINSKEYTQPESTIFNTDESYNSEFISDTSENIKNNSSELLKSFTYENTYESSLNNIQKESSELISESNKGEISSDIISTTKNSENEISSEIESTNINSDKITTINSEEASTENKLTDTNTNSEEAHKSESTIFGTDKSYISESLMNTKESESSSNNIQESSEYLSESIINKSEIIPSSQEISSDIISTNGNKELSGSTSNIIFSEKESTNINSEMANDSILESSEISSIEGKLNGTNTDSIESFKPERTIFETTKSYESSEIMSESQISSDIISTNENKEISDSISKELSSEIKSTNINSNIITTTNSEELHQFENTIFDIDASYIDINTMEHSSNIISDTLENNKEVSGSTSNIISSEIESTNINSEKSFKF